MTIVGRLQRMAWSSASLLSSLPWTYEQVALSFRSLEPAELGHQCLAPRHPELRRTAGRSTVAASMLPICESHDASGIRVRAPS